MSLRIALLGAGGHAKVVAATLRRLGWTLVGCVDEVHASAADALFEGVPLAGPAALAAWGGPAGLALHVAIGDNRVRRARFEWLRAAGWRLPAVLDPSAVVADPRAPGAGSYVGPQAVLNPGASIGAAVIVNSGAIVEHDCVVADGVHLAPRTVLGGHARVGEQSFIGMGSIVRDRAEVGARVMLGAGSLVLRSLPADCIAWGVPARVRGAAGGLT